MGDEGGAGSTAFFPSGFVLDLQHAGAIFIFPNGFTLSPGASVKVHTKVGQNTATDLFWGLRKPIWDNDFDTAVLFNFAGDEITRLSYMFAPQGMVIPGQTLAFDLMVPVFKANPSTFTGVVLEDGDLVRLDPDPNSSIWTGNLFNGNFGPAGHPGDNAPVDLDNPWPLPGAPRFALLAGTEGGPPVLVGGPRSHRS